jgi:LysR family transcriptional regulator, transcriptional activator for bauABCD operon
MDQAGSTIHFRDLIFTSEKFEVSSPMLGSVADIDLKLLKVFVTVVRCGGFAASQSVLNVSQANISMQMKQLEDRLGVRLCHRGRSGFWLTPEGKEVFDACQTLLRSLDEFRSAVSASSGRIGGRLHISVIDNAIFNQTFRLSEAIATFKAQSSPSEVVLYVVAPGAVEQMVFDGSCDLGIGFFPARRQGLEYHALFSAGMNLYCGRQNPLFDAAPDRLTLDEVLAQEHAARGYVSDAQLPSFEKQFLVGASSSTVEGLATFVLSGRYTAYLPDHYARHWVANDLIRPILPKRIGYASVYEMITKKTDRQGRLLGSFVDILKNLHGEILAEGFGIGTSI